jgi:hypothetical protein
MALAVSRRSLVAAAALLAWGCGPGAPERAVRSRLQHDFPRLLLVRIVEATITARREQPQRTATVMLVLDVYSLDGWRRMSVPAQVIFVQEGGPARWELLSLGRDWNDSNEDFRVFDRARWAANYAVMPAAWEAIQQDLKNTPPASIRATRIVEAVQLLKHAIDEHVLKLEQIQDAELRDRLAANNLGPVL